MKRKILLSFFLFGISALQLSAKECNCFEKELVFERGIIDLGDQVVFPVIPDYLTEEEVFSWPTEIAGKLSRKEMLIKAVKNRKQAKKRLEKAQAILEDEGLFCDKIESLWYAATSMALHIICGGPAPVWAPAVTALVIFSSHELFKILKQKEAYKNHLNEAERYAKECDHWLYQLVKNYGC